ncbi:ATP-binding protein [Aliikangiella sp. IMCC44632]
MFNPSQWSLKSKFISISLITLLIPISSIFLLQAVEKGLVNNLKSNLELAAKLYSLQLNQHANWFATQTQEKPDNSLAKELFVFPLSEKINVDGYFDEWEYYEKFRSSFSSSQALQASNNSPQMASNEKLSVLLGASQQHLFVSLAVTDEQIIYKDAVNSYVADQVMVEYIDSSDIPQQIFIQPNGQGRIPVKRLQNKQLKIDWRFSAQWVETQLGFQLEIRFPFKLSPKQLGISFYDVDQKNANTYKQLFTTNRFDRNSLVWPVKEIEEYTQNLSIILGQRLWVLDAQGRVLARKGSLQSPQSQYNKLAAWLFGEQSQNYDKRQDRLRLNNPLISAAINSRTASAIEKSLDGDFSIAVAATPIIKADKLLGVILLEENVARVQFLQQQALSRMVWVTSGLILIVLIIISWYVGRLIRRISLLRKQVKSVADSDGRIASPPELIFEKGDEIAELSNAFYEMGNKLYEYNDYLEKLASRLSHELRTPIAVVRSSLDNLLLHDLPADNKATIERALIGTSRLGEIITRMRHASGIKEAMQTACVETVKVNQLVQQLIDGYRTTFKTFQFEYSQSSENLFANLSADLFAEMLDKLLANAMDFCTQGKPIVITLEKKSEWIELVVFNQGPLIEKKNRKKIFSSLVSIRGEDSKNEGNLGLGLYVVKLVAEFHRGSVTVSNHTTPAGVSFCVRVPQAKA